MRQFSCCVDYVGLVLLLSRTYSRTTAACNTDLGFYWHTAFLFLSAVLEASDNMYIYISKSVLKGLCFSHMTGASHASHLTK